MPTYDFKCPGLKGRYGSPSKPCRDWSEHVRLEYFDLPVHCPTCSAIGKRQVSKGTSFQLKGGGWAKDGYSGGSDA